MADSSQRQSTESGSYLMFVPFFANFRLGLNQKGGSKDCCAGPDESEQAAQDMLTLFWQAEELTRESDCLYEKQNRTAV